MSYKLPLVIGSVVLAGVLAVTLASTAGAAGFDGGVIGGIEAARGNDVPSILLGDGGALTTIINSLLFIVGFLSVRRKSGDGYKREEYDSLCNRRSCDCDLCICNYQLRY
jgi:hypothetical protein